MMSRQDAPEPTRAHATFASRWRALHDPLPPSPQQPREAGHPPVPIIAIFALTGGSGKTSLVTTLGRILSSVGERVVLVDTNPDGPLPAYFGLQSLQPGSVVSVPQPIGGTEAPITLACYDLETVSSDPVRQEQFVEHLHHLGARSSRVLIDLTERAGWLLRRLASSALTVLIPVAPTMGSVISLQAVERFFRDFTAPGGRNIQPVYLINRFDDSAPGQRDVRDFLQRQVGDRLLPLVVRPSPGVGQALAGGMTVVQYAPNAPVSADYKAVAEWLRVASPPAPAPPQPPQRHSRWSPP